MGSDLLEWLRQPEYTGENRCGPCTVLNVLIATVVGSLVARKSKVGGVLAVGVSLALIYLRGYLVPGTPTLTKRYLPPAVLQLFGKEPDLEVAAGFGGSEAPSSRSGGGEAPSSRSHEPSTTDAESSAAETEPSETTGHDETTPTTTPSTDETEANGGDAHAIDPTTDLERYYLENGILEPCEDRDDLCLTDDFEAAWFDEIEALEATTLDGATAIDAFGFDADPDAFALEQRDDIVLLRSDHGAAGRWPSRAAVLADVAASRTLETWVDDWDAVDADTRGQLCNALRMFLETCPTGGDVHMGEEVVESCCSSHDVVAVTCEESGERLFEQRLDAVER